MFADTFGFKTIDYYLTKEKHKKLALNLILVLLKMAMHFGKDSSLHTRAP